MPPVSTRQNARRLASIAARQDQTASRAQLTASGYDSDAVRRRVRAGRWQTSGRAIVLHNAELTGRNLQWAAVLSVKGPAAVCGRTAAAGYRLRGFDSEHIEVLIDAKERVPAIEGVKWRRRRGFTAADISPGPRPAAVRPARAVIDAASWTDQPRVACALLIASVQQRVTKVAALREALDAAGLIRHRSHLTAVLIDIEGGVDSLSERDFDKLRRRAGLPPPIRQSVRVDASGRRRYIDADFGVFSVEIDGGFHLRPLNYWADARRQNELVLGGNRILRFPSVAIRLEPEVVVAQLRAAAIAFGLIKVPTSELSCN
jgi:hypothetical protein